jgi:hypothetical protein
MDATGNTILANNLSVPGNVTAGNFIGNLTAVIAAPQTANIINATMAGSDYFRLQLGGSTEQGQVAFDVGDEGSETIIFRQFTGPNFATESRRVTLLNSQGNAIFPQTVSATGFLGTSLSVSGTITGGTITGAISTAGTITAGSVVGNLNGTTVNATNHTGTTVSVTGSVTGSTYTGTTVSVTGSVTAASLVGNVTATAISATSLTGTIVSMLGNITASNFIATSTGTGNNYQVGTKAFIGDVNVNDTIIVKGQQNSANGYIIFGTNQNGNALGRTGTGPLTYTGDFSTTGSITANSFVGPIDIGNTDVNANSFTSNNFYGGNFFGKLTTNVITGSNTEEIISSNIADNDYFRVIVGGTGIDQGYVSFETGDGGNEPIYFRQYNGATKQNEVTLLDASGNSIFKNITANNFVGNLSVTTPTVFTSANIVSGIMASNDGFRIQISGSGSGQGNAYIDTTDGSSLSPTPIIFRQFSGLTYTSEVRSLTLLDRNGNTVLPGRLTAAGNVSLLQNLSVTGAIVVPQLNTTGSITTSLTVSATGNIDTSATLNAGTVSATGVVRGFTLSATGAVSTTGAVNAGSINSTGIISVTANLNSANVNTGNITATGNIQGSTLIGNVTATAISATSVTGTTSSVTGNVTGNILISTATGTGNNFKVGSRVWLGEVNVNDTVIVQGQQNPANGYIIFGNSQNGNTLGRSGTGPLTYTGDMSLSGNVTANNFIGNINIGSGDISANSFTSNNFYGGNFVGTLTTNALTGSNTAELIRANIANSDIFSLTVGGNTADAGYAIFDVGDNGSEQIIFRQLTGATPTRTLTLLDANGSTTLANSLTVPGSIYGNLSMSVAGGATANIIDATMGGSDRFRIQLFGSSTQGQVAFDTGFTGSEPILFRQFTGTSLNPYQAVYRQVTLLDTTGNSIFQGSLSVGGELSVAGTIRTASTANLSIGGIVASNNITTTQLISASGNITSGTNLIAAANVNGTNFNASGLISVTGAANVGSINSTGIISTTANVNSANINTGNVFATTTVNASSHTGATVSVTGTVTAASLVGNVTATAISATSVTGTTSSVTGNVTGNIIISTNTGTGNNFRVGAKAWIGDVNINDAVVLKGQQSSANGYIIFGDSDTVGRLGRSGTGPLTYSGDVSLTGNITAGNLIGTINSAQDITANNITANTFIGGNFRGVLTTANLTGTSNANLILANIANSDYFKLTVGGSGADQGFVAFDIGDNGDETILFRQYNGPTPRTLTLLDSTGNTQLPGNLSLAGNITTTANVTANSFVGNLRISLTGSNTANIVSATIADNDYFRIQVGGTTGNSGYVSFDTANEGTEPIYFRQYLSTQVDPYPNPPARTLTLLDAGGNTILPGSLSVTGTAVLTTVTATTSIVGNIVTPTITTGNANALYGAIASGDYYRIQVGGSGDSGFISIDTADNGNEPIYVRQYTNSGGNPFGTISRELTLLDANGNTTLPGNLIINGTGNSTIYSPIISSNYNIGFRGYPVRSIGTSYTIQTTDQGSTLYFTGQSGGTLLNLPTDATANLPLGSQLRIINGDASQNITVTPAIGVTMRYQGSNGSRTLSTYADTTLIKVAADTWFINGYGIT